MSTDPHPYKIGALEWMHDSKLGQRSHVWAEDPKPAPAILCESEEQADAMLAFHAYQEKQRLYRERIDTLQRVPAEHRSCGGPWHDEPHANFSTCPSCGGKKWEVAKGTHTSQGK